jgi:hypothetical protein
MPNMLAALAMKAAASRSFAVSSVTEASPQIKVIALEKPFG